MGRGASKAAQNQLGLSNQTAANYGARAGGLFSTITPQLQSDVTNPQGYTPGQLNDMRTASMQSVGGATAAAKGDLGLTAARTRNSGGATAGEDEAVRSGERQESQNAVGIESDNARVAQQKRESALSGLEGIYGDNLKGQLSALGLGPAELNAWTNADQATTQGWLGPLGSITGLLGSGYKSYAESH